MSDAQKKEYKGSCHCGAVHYTVNLDLKDALACNCSICSKSGNLLTFTTEDNFKYLGKVEDLQDYQFNKKAIHHNFCKICGIKAFAYGKTPDGKPSIAINVRCLDGVDIEKLPKIFYDGASK